MQRFTHRHFAKDFSGLLFHDAHGITETVRLHSPLPAGYTAIFVRSVLSATAAHFCNGQWMQVEAVERDLDDNDDKVAAWYNLVSFTS